MVSRLRDRPLALALLIGAVAQALFCYRLNIPAKPFFDEVHYVPAARTLLALAEPVNTEHPLLAKELIALGIRLFGDGPVGWRAFSTLAGTATVLGSFALLHLLFRSTRTAAFGALCVLLNHTVYIQARIAMLDGFLGAFTVCGLAALVWALQAPPARVRRRLLLAGVLLGAATATKWAAAPYVALACVVIWWSKRWPALGSGGEALPGTRTTPAILMVGLTSVATYFATFLPAFFYARDPLTPARLLPFQWEMYQRQTQILSPHTYQSDWWSWPLLLRPIWYLYEPDSGAQRGVLLLGNPVVMWGGLLAVVACLWAGWTRHDRASGGLALLWLFSVALFAIIPKSIGFYYYYHLSGIFICWALAAAFHAVPRLARGRADLWFLAAALAAFVHFWPILSAAPLADAQAFNRWMYFGSWR